MRWDAQIYSYGSITTRDYLVDEGIHLCHRIRAAMREINAELLRGVVEVDETLYE